MTMTATLDAWEAERKQLLARIAALGDLRPGSLNSTYVTCGKANCRCTQGGDQRHGPHWFLTYSVNGKTRTRSIPKAEWQATRAQIAECQRLRELVAKLVAVSTKLCQSRLQQRRRGAPDSGIKKPGRRSSRPRPPPNSSAS